MKLLVSKEKLKYEVKSHEEARKIAKGIIAEYGIDDAVTLAESNKFHGDVNAMIFNEALDNLYNAENIAKECVLKTIFRS